MGNQGLRKISADQNFFSFVDLEWSDPGLDTDAIQRSQLTDSLLEYGYGSISTPHDYLVLEGAYLLHTQGSKPDDVVQRFVLHAYHKKIRTFGPCYQILLVYRAESSAEELPFIRARAN